VAVHGVAYASLALAPRPPEERAPSRVTVRVRELPKPELPEPPKPEAPEPPKPPKPRERPKPPPPDIAAAAPPPEAAPLQGVTLTNESGTGSFTSAVGDGSSFTGPVGAIAPRAVPAPVAPAPALGPKPAPAIPLVALADLSEKPRPPALGSALREHYPVDARQRGIGGSATVKARVDADGRIRKVELVSETFPGFGDACRRTLGGSQWSAPKDREGRAVSTAIRYTCRFVVQP
jgi:protein TonB